MNLITKGYGEKNLIITRGLGTTFKIEVKKVAVREGVAPQWRVRVFEKRIPVLGDVVFDFKKEIKITGIHDLYPVIVALQDETPSTEDDILELVYIWKTLKARIKREEVVKQETLELFVETKELLDLLMKKLKREVVENEK